MTNTMSEWREETKRELSVKRKYLESQRIRLEADIEKIDNRLADIAKEEEKEQT